MAQLISSTDIIVYSNEFAETEWFDGKKFVPHHVGVYEKRFHEGGASVWQYWDGSFWCKYCTDAVRAVKFRGDRSDYQNLDWRGMRCGSVGPQMKGTEK